MSVNMRAAVKKVIPAGIRRLIYNARVALAHVAPLDRKFIADKFLHGEGIEIGALHMPLKVPRSAKVKYVDRLTTDQLRLHYPEMAGVNLVEPDFIDDGQTLQTIADSTQDFVIANHFIEHAPDPFGAIVNFFRVLKTDGVLFLVIPDKRFTFDLDRPVTPLAHLIKDHEDGPDWSREAHYLEWARLVDGTSEANVKNRALELMKLDYSIHFHVWTPFEMLEMISYLKTGIGLDFSFELFCRNADECIFVLRKN